MEFNSNTVRSGVRRSGIIGNVGRHLYITRDQNSPIYNPSCTSATCGTTAGQNNRRPYQPTPTTYTFAAISLAAPVANSSYHSLQATLTRRFDRHFSIQASYVWSKVMGYGTFGQCLRSEQLPRPARDRCSQQLRGVVHLCHTGRSRISVSSARTVLSGWQINGITTLRSGQPFNVTSGIDTNFDATNNDQAECRRKSVSAGWSRKNRYEERLLQYGGICHAARGSPLRQCQVRYAVWPEIRQHGSLSLQIISYLSVRPICNSEARSSTSSTMST